MAQYRRKLTTSKNKYILDKYKHHKNDDVGIFTSDKRRKLLGLKPKDRKIKHDNIPNFWSDVRNSVKIGLTDLQLIADVADHNQLRQMFKLIPFSEWDKDISKTDLPKLCRTILSSQPRSRVVKRKGMLVPAENEEDDVWLAHLAYEIVIECFRFFKDHNLVTSMAHERLIDETEDMLNSEIGRAWFVTRGRRKIKF